MNEPALGGGAPQQTKGELEKARRALGDAEEVRLLADYGTSAPLTPAGVRPVLADVERFIEAVEAALSADGASADEPEV